VAVSFCLESDPMSTRVPRSVPLLLATVVLAACATAAGPSASPGSQPPSAAPSPSPSPSATPSPASLLLRVTSEGGFIGPTASLAALPTVSVYTDGRILTPGPVDAIYPGPLVPPVAGRDVGPAGADAIVQAIRAAGLDQATTSSPGLPGDTGATVFDVVLDGRTTTTRYGQAGPGGPGIPGGPGGPGASGGDPARDAAFALLDRLTDPGDTWGAASAPQSILVPTGYRIFVVTGGPPADPAASQAPAEWPLPTSLDAFGAPAIPDRGIPGLRSGVVLGDDAAALAPFLSRLTTLTPVASGGNSYTLYVRPLLPDEVGG
jgi:hypothetical protein